MDIDSLLNLALNDPGLPNSQKKELGDDHVKKTIAKLLSGGAGAGVLLAASKFSNLSRSTQIMLAALGFGIGTVVYDFYHRNKFAYNEGGTYKIDTQKF